MSDYYYWLNYQYKFNCCTEMLMHCFYRLYQIVSILNFFFIWRKLGYGYFYNNYVHWNWYSRINLECQLVNSQYLFPNFNCICHQTDQIKKQLIQLILFKTLIHLYITKEDKLIFLWSTKHIIGHHCQNKLLCTVRYGVIVRESNSKCGAWCFSPAHTHTHPVLAGWWLIVNKSSNRYTTCAVGIAQQARKLYVQ